MAWRDGKVRKDQTDSYGRVKKEGPISLSNFEDSDDIHFSQSAESSKISAELQEAVKQIINNALSVNDFDSSEEIVMDISEGVIKFLLQNDISNKINNSLQLPMTTPTAMELVGVDTSKSQTRIGLDEVSILDWYQGKLTTTNVFRLFKNYINLESAQQTLQIDTTERDRLYNLLAHGFNTYCVYGDPFNIGPPARLLLRPCVLQSEQLILFGVAMAGVPSLFITQPIERTSTSVVLIRYRLNTVSQELTTNDIAIMYQLRDEIEKLKQDIDLLKKGAN